jgi:acetyl esterase/lipase
LARGLAWRGYLTYDINYRLVGEGGGYPRDIRDVKQAVDFLAANASKLGIDKTKIAVIGSGAGGYLAMMAAYTPSSGRFAPHGTLPPAKIAAIGSFFAPNDLEGIGNGAGSEEMQREISGYLHTTYTQDSAMYRRASPKSFDNTAVPTIFFHGIADSDEPFAQTFRLYRYLKQRSIPAQLEDLPGSPHGFADLTGTSRSQMLDQLTSFFDGVFYQPPYRPGT